MDGGSGLGPNFVSASATSHNFIGFFLFLFNPRTSLFFKSTYTRTRLPTYAAGSWTPVYEVSSHVLVLSFARRRRRHSRSFANNRKTARCSCVTSEKRCGRWKKHPLERRRWSFARRCSSLITKRRTTWPRSWRTRFCVASSKHSPTIQRGTSPSGLGTPSSSKC